MPDKLINPFPVHNPKIIYEEAEAFLRASNVILTATNSERMKDMKWSFSLQYASYVNHAFAIELYIKCLIALETGYCWQGHKLHDLFLRLPVSIRSEIIRVYDSTVFINETLINMMQSGKRHDFESLLQHSSNAFVELRYIFQRENLGDYDLSFLVHPIKSAIRSHKNVWS